MYIWKMRIKADGSVSFQYAEHKEGESAPVFANNLMTATLEEDNPRIQALVDSAKSMYKTLKMKDELTVTVSKKATIACTRPFIDADIFICENDETSLKINIGAALTKSQYNSIFDFAWTMRREGWLV